MSTTERSPTHEKNLETLLRASDPLQQLRGLRVTGVLSRDDVFRSDGSVQVLAGRHRVTLVRMLDRTIVIKEYESPFYLERECNALCAMARTHGVSTPVVELKLQRVLVTTTPPNLEPLTVRAGDGLVRRRVLRDLLQAFTSMWELSSPDRTVPPVSMPLSPDLIGPAVLDDSSAVQALYRKLQASGPVQEAMATIRESARSTDQVWCHGDIRASNILTVGRLDLALLIDWELSGAGPPWIDVGALLGLVLEASIGSRVHGPDRAGVELVLTLARRTREIVTVSSIRAAGLRLLQAAVESCAQEGGTSPYVDRLVEIGTILLTQPRDAARLLGLLG